MSRITLCLAIHNHQPVGNFDWVFADAYEQAYLPMLQALEDHPGVRIALHCSGSLLDWIRSQRPEYLARASALAASGQVELLSGAYYEPILVMIPDVDKVGQVRKLSQVVRDELGFEPTGVWLAERVWEPQLARPLAEAGASYTILDDTHFRMAGFAAEELTGCFVTEEQGHTLKVFAGSTFLRYAIPWWPVDEVISWLLRQADESPGAVLAMGDDGEKFGLWPGTHDYCWSDGAWVERFFSELESHAERIEMALPGEVAANRLPQGRAYLPCGSYDEMAGWALPPDAAAALKGIREELQAQGRHDVLRFVKGGLWRGFLARYDEANQMQKKMLWVSRKVHGLPEGEEKARALDRVWAAQCNCGYWHGVFGGVYLSHIRAANYANLIEAEEIADRGRLAKQGLLVKEGDVDGDGNSDVLLANEQQVLVLKPSGGGSLVEWDWRAQRTNVLNTMTRRPEAYHRELVEAAQAGHLVLAGKKGDRVPGAVVVQEYDIADSLFYDWHRRASLLDHFLDQSADLAGFSRSRYAERGDFVPEPYTAVVKKRGGSARLQMAREGGVWVGDDRAPVRVDKTVTLEAGATGLLVAYAVTNQGDRRMGARFGVEFNWGLSGDAGSDYLTVGKARLEAGVAGERAGVSVLAVGTSAQEGVEIGVRSGEPAGVWHFPIEVVASSDGGFERSYQGFCSLLWWDLALDPGAKWENELRFELGT